MHGTQHNPWLNTEMPGVLSGSTFCNDDNRDQEHFQTAILARAGSQPDLGQYDMALCSGVTVLFVMTVE